MSELKLTIEDNYLHAFLNMLQSLNYVSVEQVTPSSKKKQKNKLDNLAKNHPLREAIKPIRPFVSLQDLAKEQNYTKTDWQALDKIGSIRAEPEQREMGRSDAFSSLKTWACSIRCRPPTEVAALDAPSIASSATSLARSPIA